MTEKPSFYASISALRFDARPDLAHVFPTAEELDAADALELVHQFHVVDVDEIDEEAGETWGNCQACAKPWPCKSWLWGQSLAVQWVGKATNRYAADAIVPIISGPLPSRAASVDVIVEGEQRRLARLRAEPVITAYCREPECRTVVTLAYPPVEGWLNTAACDRHQDTPNDRYAEPFAPSIAALTEPSPGRCASCRAPISSSAEWCCEPCAFGGIAGLAAVHASTCPVRTVAAAKREQPGGAA